MMSSLYTSLSGILSSFRRHAVTAQNVANIETLGYKARRVLSRTNPSGGVDSTAIFPVNGSGPTIQTGYPLDLAVMGEGFFQFDMGDGRIGYSRCGLLTTDRNGRLSTVTGHHLVPPVTVPTGATQLRITAGGEIRAAINGQTQTVGQIELARFTNPSGLVSIGDTLLAESQTSGRPITGPPGSRGMGLLVQGALEASNVDLATEYVTDILSHLQLKANLGVLRTEDEMLGSILDIKT